MRTVPLALACVLILSDTIAGEVPGTSVSLTPPAGFVLAERFPGFMNESAGSSIMISDIPGPYADVTAGFSDAARMRAQGINLLSRSSASVDGHTAMLLAVEQAAHGTLFRKWLLAVDRSGSTTLIAATYPQSEREKQEGPLQAAILGATFGRPSDPRDALAFTATPSAPFAVAKVMGQSMILSLGGQFPVKDESIPFMILGLSASDSLAIKDQRGFAERRVMQIATVRDVRVEKSTPVEIGKLSGYATTATAFGVEKATPLTIYQVVLFDTSGYSLIQGLTPAAERNRYVPIFEEIAKTFAIKQTPIKSSGKGGR